MLVLDEESVFNNDMIMSDHIAPHNKQKATSLIKNEKFRKFIIKRDVNLKMVDYNRGLSQECLDYTDLSNILLLNGNKQDAKKTNRDKTEIFEDFICDLFSSTNVSNSVQRTMCDEKNFFGGQEIPVN